MTVSYFGVIPDGAEKPVVLFRELDDAIEWALLRYGSDQFRICRRDATPGPVAPSAAS